MGEAISSLINNAKSQKCNQELQIQGETYENKKPGKSKQRTLCKVLNDNEALPDSSSMKTGNKKGIKKCIQIISPIQTIRTNEVSFAIKRMCEALKYTSFIYDDIVQTSEKFPLVVICPISSRLEPDIDHALNEIYRKMPFAVLLIHSTLESALPKLPTASKLTQNEKYEQVVFIDIAYNIESKLYHCKMNDTARKNMKSFFKSFFKEQKEQTYREQKRTELVFV